MSNDSRPLTQDFPPVDYTTWRRRVAEDLQSEDPVQELVTRLVGGLEVQPLYTEETSSVLESDSAAQRSTRGWLICQNYRLDDPETAALAIQNDLENGVDGFSIGFDRVNQESHAPPGIDEDLEFRTGWLRSRLEEIFPEDGPLPRALLLDSTVSTPSTANAALSWSIAHQLDEPRKLGLGVDPLGHAVLEGGLPESPEMIAGQIQDLLGRVGDRNDRPRLLGIATQAYLDGGADASYQVALALATAVEYMRWLESVGTGPCDVADQIVFRFGIGKDFFGEIAKLRAFRHLWSLVARRCGACLEEEIWIHADTSNRILTGRDLSTNLLRTTPGVLAAVLGGAGTISCAAYDAVLGSPSRRARRLARNTQHILRDESHLDLVADPSAGSYYIESLTSEIATKSWTEFRDLEQRGGMLASLQTGYVQTRLTDLWRQQRQRFSDRTDPITGISFFAVPGSDSSDSRARAAGGEGFDESEQPVSDRQGQVSLPPVELHRDSEDFERLRKRADRIADQLGYIPKSYLLPAPSLAEARHIVAFARNLLAGGGFDIVVQGDIDDWIADPRSVLCICANTIEDLDAARRTFADAGTRTGPITAWASGKEPPIDADPPAGIQAILHPDVDAVEVLSQLLGSLADRLREDR